MVSSPSSSDEDISTSKDLQEYHRICREQDEVYQLSLEMDRKKVWKQLLFFMFKVNAFMYNIRKKSNKGIE